MGATVLLLAIFYLGVGLLRREMYRRRVSTCPHPLPGRSFVWQRCMYGECAWCDAIEEYERTERPTGHGPYRSRGA